MRHLRIILKLLAFSALIGLLMVGAFYLLDTGLLETVVNNAPINIDKNQPFLIAMRLFIYLTSLFIMLNILWRKNTPNKNIKFFLVRFSCIFIIFELVLVQGIHTKL